MVGVDFKNMGPREIKWQDTITMLSDSFYIGNMIKSTVAARGRGK